MKLEAADEIARAEIAKAAEHYEQGTTWTIARYELDLSNGMRLSVDLLRKEDGTHDGWLGPWQWRVHRKLSGRDQKISEWDSLGFGTAPGCELAKHAAYACALRSLTPSPSTLVKEAEETKVPAHIEQSNDSPWGSYRCRECGAQAGRGCSYSGPVHMRHEAKCSHVTPVGPGPGGRGELIEHAARKIGDPI